MSCRVRRSLSFRGRTLKSIDLRRPASSSWPADLTPMRGISCCLVVPRKVFTLQGLCTLARIKIAFSNRHHSYLFFFLILSELYSGVVCDGWWDTGNRRVSTIRSRIRIRWRSTRPGIEAIGLWPNTSISRNLGMIIRCQHDGSFSVLEHTPGRSSSSSNQIYAVPHCLGCSRILENCDD